MLRPYRISIELRIKMSEIYFETDDTLVQIYSITQKL